MGHIRGYDGSQSILYYKACQSPDPSLSSQVHWELNGKASEDSILSVSSKCGNGNSEHMVNLVTECYTSYMIYIHVHEA